jgi:S-formylglutathione hydrolase FrmB
MSDSHPHRFVEHPFRTVEISDPSLEAQGLRWVTVKSRALAQRCDTCVFECPGASASAAAPVVILLHGVYGSHWAWALKGGAHRTAARLAAAGRIRPMVLAMPSDGLWGDGSGYLPHRTQDFERWIVEEVPLVARLASTACSADSPLFIAGLSMGGFGALRLAAKYPQKFRAASAHSAATHFSQMENFVEEHPATFTVLEEDRCVLDQMLRSRDRLPPVRFDCGREDVLLEGNRRLHEALVAAGVPHVYEEFSGGYTWPYWTEHLEDSLLFFERCLAARSGA